MTESTIDQLTPEWKREVKRLRTSCARYRMRAKQMEMERDAALAQAEVYREAYHRATSARAVLVDV